jgi:hypothetical protein
VTSCLEGTALVIGMLRDVHVLASPVRLGPVQAGAAATGCRYKSACRAGRIRMGCWSISSREVSVVGKEEARAKFSLFGGPRPGELFTAEGVEDTTPEGSAFLDLVAREEDSRAKKFSELLDSGSAPYHSLRDKLGSLLSLMDRLGSCWWGCSGGDHTVAYTVAASVGNALAALRLLRAGYYDEPLGLARQIGERANLLQLFLFDDQSLKDWSDASSEIRRRKFSAINIRLRLEGVKVPPVVPEEHYRYLSGFGVHPGRTPQHFGEKFPPTVGGMFRPRGLLIALNELAYAVAMVGAIGAVLLGDDERIPS